MAYALTADLVLSNTKAYMNQELVDCSLAIDDGKIIKIGRQSAMPHADRKIDLKRRLVLPGLIDVHVHLRDQRKAYKEDFYTGTTAAAAGGITTVLDMPNNDPVTMNAGILKERMELAQRKTIVNVGFYSEFPKDKADIEKIVSAGAVAFKLFMGNQIGGLNVDDDHTLKEAFTVLSTLKVPVAVHAEDRAMLKRAEDESKKAGQNSCDDFVRVHSENVEVAAVQRVMRLASSSGCRVHFCHMSSREGLEKVIQGKRSALPVTCEVTPHHLLLSIDDLCRVGGLALTMPPFRERYHAERLLWGVKNGWVDVLASDHAPHTIQEKQAGNVWDVKVGIPGLETTLPLLLTQVNHGLLSIGDIVRLMGEKSALIFGLEGKGSLKEGNDADLTVVDLDVRYKIDASKFHSKAKYSPFDQWEVQGKPVKTFVKGQLIMDDGETIAKAGSGQVIRRN